MTWRTSSIADVGRVRQSRAVAGACLTSARPDRHRVVTDGAGKTTLLGAIIGALPATAGRAIYSLRRPRFTPPKVPIADGAPHYACPRAARSFRRDERCRHPAARRVQRYRSGQRDHQQRSKKCAAVSRALRVANQLAARCPARAAMLQSRALMASRSAGRDEPSLGLRR